MTLSGLLTPGKLALLLLVFSGCASRSESATNDASLTRHRVSVVLLPPKNVSERTELDHWSPTILTIVRSRLKARGDIYVVPESSVSFAFKTLNLDTNRPLDLDQARALGGFLEARCVLSGSYSKKGTNWNLTLQASDAVVGKSLGTFAVSSDD